MWESVCIIRMFSTESIDLNEHFFKIISAAVQHILFSAKLFEM